VLAWTLEQGSVTHVLSGMRDERQARENVKAAHIALSAEEIADITRKLDAAALSIPSVYG